MVKVWDQVLVVGGRALRLPSLARVLSSYSEAAYILRPCLVLAAYTDSVEAMTKVWILFFGVLADRVDVVLAVVIGLNVIVDFGP